MKRLVNVGIIACLLILSIALALRVWSLECRIDSQVQGKQQLELLTGAIEVSRTVDKEGKKHATFKVPEAFTKEELDSFPAAGLIDTAAQALKIKNSQIKELHQIKAVLEADNLRLQKEINAQKEEVFYYKDKFLSIVYHKPIASDSTDFGRIDFKYDAKLNITKYSKRNWLLGKKADYIDIYSEDPRVTIHGLKTYTLQNEVKANSIAFQASSQYDFATNTLQAGPALSIDFNRFNITGKYLHNPQTNKWSWFAGGSFNVLKL